MVDVYRKAEASEGLASRGAVLGVAVRVEGHHLGSSVSMFSIRCTTLCTVQSSWKVMTTLALRKKKSARKEKSSSPQQWGRGQCQAVRAEAPEIDQDQNSHQSLSILIKCSSIIINFHQLWSLFINYDQFSSIMINFHQLWSRSETGADCICPGSWLG